MKDYKGGYSILDLTPLPIDPSGVYISVDDEYVLSQLKEILLSHCLEIKPLKAIYCRCVLNGVGFVTILGSIAQVNVSGFVISLDYLDYHIVINVELSQDEETLEWSISNCEISSFNTVDKVNSGIENGDIEVGTKLYLHSGSIGGETFNIICPVSTPFNAQNVKPYYIGYSDTDENICFISESEGIFSLNDVNGLASSGLEISDTVTPL